MCRAAREAHPGLDIADGDFLAYVVARLDARRDDDRLLAIASDDLYLACGAVRGDPAALARFDAIILADVRKALAAMRLAAHRIDELMQELRASLLVGAPPRLASFAGRGSLRRWVRSVAVRMAIDALRVAPREVALDDVLLEEIHRGAEPARDRIADRYRPTLQRALGDAMRSLSARQRNALKLHVVDGVTLDQLAGLYGVHRATVARWLALTRQQIVERTLAGIREHLGVEDSEAESLLRQAVSRLSVSAGQLDRDD